MPKNDFSTASNLIKKRAAKGNKDHVWSEPIVLYEDRQERKVFFATYGNQEAPQELFISLRTYRKKPNWPEMICEKTIQFDENSSRKLYEAIRSQLMISQEKGTGYYIFLSDAQENIENLLDNLDTKQVNKAFRSILTDKRILKFIQNQELSSVLRDSLNSAIRLSEITSAMAKLNHLLEQGIVKEQKYQEWCEEHSWAFGNAYVLCDQTRTISRIHNVDLLIPNALTGYRDIVELKRPNMEVLRYDSSHDSYYFSEDTSIAIGQSHQYLDSLHKLAEDGLLGKKEIVAYHPKAIIVIGRSKDWNDAKKHALHGLNQRLSCISIMTYDHLLAQGERMLQVLSRADQANSNSKDSRSPSQIDHLTPTIPISDQDD